MMKKATQQQQAVGVTSVFWDIKTCPVPPDSDARLIGPCIKRCLKNLGYSGPLTVISVGLLIDVPHDVLRAVSSTGIILNHVSLGYKGILGAIYDCAENDPPPVNMMLISSNPSIFPQIQPNLHSRGYNIFQLFPYESPNAESLWKHFLLEGALKQDEFSSTGESEPAHWLCSLCCDFLCHGFENFTTHLSSQQHEHKATQMDEEAVAVTSVFWDIKTCPVPPDCDARRVGPCIKQYLEYLGYSGPLTINAVGLLTDVPHDVLRAVSSTGVVLNHNSEDIVRFMYRWWTYFNSSPANLMVICPYSEAFAKAVVTLQEWGYNIIEPFPYGSPYSESLWENFLLEDSGTLEEDKCSETGEHASWVCSDCKDISGIGFEKFTTHLSSQQHDPESEMNQGVSAVTSVFWDIKSFPVPPDCDVGWVGPCIKQFLADLGYSGPPTINAIGLLTDVPDDVLRAVSSTGIVLNHVASNSADIMYAWSGLNPPPANMMLILPYSEALAKGVCKLRESGYEIIQPFLYDPPYSEYQWKTFLLEGSRTIEEDKCSETGEHASWVCSVCDGIIGKGFENFTTHLSSQEHESKMRVVDTCVDGGPMITAPAVVSNKKKLVTDGGRG